MTSHCRSAAVFWILLLCTLAGCVDSDAALFEAARNGETETLRKLVSEGGNVEAKDKDGWHALHAAVYSLDVGSVSVLLNAGADPNASGPEGVTPLLNAVSGNQLEVVKLLLQHGAEVNPEGYGPLHEAARAGHLECMALLIESGSRVDNAASGLGEPLYWAALAGQIAAVEALIDAGAEVNAATAGPHGATALLAAATMGRAEVVEKLLDAGADPELASDGENALQAAQRNGHRDVVRLLEADGPADD